MGLYRCIVTLKLCKRHNKKSEIVSNSRYRAYLNGSENC